MSNIVDFRQPDELYVKVECEFKFLPRSGKSVCVLVNGEGERKFIPLSVIHHGDSSRLDNYSDGDEVVLQVMKWFAKKELGVE